MAFFCASSALNSEVAVSLRDCWYRACAFARSSRVERSCSHQSWKSGWETRLRTSERRTGRIRPPVYAGAYDAGEKTNGYETGTSSSGLKGKIQLRMTV